MGVERGIAVPHPRGEHIGRVRNIANEQEHFLSHPRPVFPEPPNGFLPSRLASLATRTFIHQQLGF